MDKSWTSGDNSATVHRCPDFCTDYSQLINGDVHMLWRRRRGPRIKRVNKDVLPWWWKRFAGYERWLADELKRRGIPTYDLYAIAHARAHIPKGAIVGIDAGGYLTGATDESPGVVVGVAQESHHALLSPLGRAKLVKVAIAGRVTYRNA